MKLRYYVGAAFLGCMFLTGVIYDQTHPVEIPEPVQPAPIVEVAEPEAEPEQAPEITVDDLTYEAIVAAEATATPDWYNPVIPLSEEEQKALQRACKEFEIPYSLALAIIDKETGFVNRSGDNGNSVGYMQIQPKWWRWLADEIGAGRLECPGDNFRVGCAILRRHLNATGDVAAALTVYNVGHDDGTRDYAKEVLEKAEVWDGRI